MEPNDPIRNIRQWKKGEPLKKARLNESVDAINRISGGITPPRQLSASARPIPTGSTSKVQQFVVNSVYGDYLSCYPYNGLQINTTAVILVAKPYLLRQTPFNGSSRNGVSYTYTSAIQRTATDGSTDETHVITPSYVTNDIIYAIRNIVGKTATYNSQLDIIEWLDMNVDGRSWAVQA